MEPTVEQQLQAIRDGAERAALLCQRDLLTVDELATLTGKSPRWVRDVLHHLAIPVYRPLPGERSGVMVRRREFERAIEKTRTTL